MRIGVPRKFWLSAVLGLVVCAGCLSSTHNAIPVDRLPPSFLPPSKRHLVPVDYTLLGRTQPPHHVIGAGDVLGIHIEGVLDNESEAPPVHFFNEPTDGRPPSAGQPISVREDGTVRLPLLDSPVLLAGLTLDEAEDRLREVYTLEEREIANVDRKFFVTLMQPRTVQVIVVRQDAPASTPANKMREAAVISKRGSAWVLNLTVPQNDILHALALSGGHPGNDAKNALWVLRGGAGRWQELAARLEQGQTPEVVFDQQMPLKVPLRIPPGALLPFSEEDVTLHNGDVVFIESREYEYYYTGGFLPGGTYPLPRDYDLDIFGAISAAGGSPGGPGGSNAAAQLFRTGSGPGNIIPPTRLIVLRTMPDGRQLKIHVNLKDAQDDVRQRLIIQPQDVLMLYYTPAELAGNIALNLVNFQFILRD